MRLEELRGALAGAGDDATNVREVVHTCVRAMRNGQVEDLLGFAHELAPWIEHPSEGVRLEIAQGCEVFPDPVFDRVFARASVDRDPFVRENAKRAAQKRAVRRKSADRTKQRTQTETALLESLERAHGKAARRTAERIARAGVEHFVERLFHEYRRIATPLERSLGTLSAELEARHPSLVVIAEQARRLREQHAYLDAILRRAREYETGVKPAFAQCRLRDVVLTAGDQLATRLGARAAHLAFTVEVDAALTLELDRHALLEALDNVLQNAVEAFDDGAPMRVTASSRTLRNGTQVELSIRDEGRGIGDSDRASLFVPFGSRKPGGTGFGMLMVRKMVEEVHGGDLLIESAPGAGTTITLRLPAKQVRR